MGHNFSDFYGKKIALLLHFLNESGEPTAALIKGTGYLQDGYLHLHRGSIAPPLPLPLKVVWRAMKANEEVRDIVGEVDFVMEARIDEIPRAKKDSSFRKSA